MKKMNLFSSKIAIIIGFLISGSAFATEQTPVVLNFFFDSQLSPMVGLSCSSEKECRDKCQNSNHCQKPVSTCLNCVGTKSPYLNDFFNNAGGLTTACYQQGFLTNQAESLFKYATMVPIFSVSPYSSLDLADQSFALRFLSLCPFGSTLEPIAISIVDSVTHAVLGVPMVKCGVSIFPLVRTGEDCAKKADQVLNYINQEKAKQDLIETSYQNIVKAGNSLSLKYEVVQYSPFTEVQYLGCATGSEPVCQKLCHSSMSCAIPLENDATSTGITNFNQGQFTSCGMERFSSEILMTYLNSKDSFSFNSFSLSQSFNPPVSKGGFSDLSIINSILGTFGGIFQNADNAQGGSFIISEAYQKILQAKMQTFCDDSSNAFIMGHKGQVERVFCRSGQNGYFKIIANLGESCTAKVGQLSISNMRNLQ